MKPIHRIVQATTLACLTSLLAGPALADDREVIRGSFIEFPPLAFTSDNGYAEGSFISLAEQIADQAGYDIRWQELPIGRVYLYLEHGRVDMWIGSSRVPELANYTIETDFQPGQIRLNAYHRSGVVPVASIDELHGKSLILIRGYTYWQILDPLREDPNTQVTVAPDHRSAIRMLAFNRGDYLINFQLPMDEILSTSPFPDLTSSNLLSWPLTFVFSSQAPGTEKMAEDLNKAWDELKKENLISLP